jgi:tetratricopeptide (TPR) repeat protein
MIVSAASPPRRGERRNSAGGAVNPTALQLYDRARTIETEALPNPAGAAEAVALLERAVATDPDFALGWARLARARVRRLRFGGAAEPYVQARASVVQATEAALRLDLGAGIAHHALSDLEAFGDYARRETLIERALAAAPTDPAVLTLVGAFHAEVGRIQQALSLATRAVSLDSGQFWPGYGLAKFLDYAGDPSSLEVWETLCELWPGTEMVFGAAWSAALHGDWPRFEAFCAQARQIEGSARRTRIRAYRWLARDLRQGDAASAEQVLKIARDGLEETGAADTDWLMILCRLGQADQAFDLVEKSSFSYMSDPAARWPNGGFAGGVIFSQAHNRAMIQDPRFPRLCARLGLCSYWIDTERWPDCAVEAGYDFQAECRRLAR